jgi:hypothetical protein
MQSGLANPKNSAFPRQVHTAPVEMERVVLNALAGGCGFAARYTLRRAKSLMLIGDSRTQK